MKTLSKVLLLICLLGFALGLGDVGSPMFSGLARAVGAVFFILAYITRMFMFIGGEPAGNLNRGAAFVPHQRTNCPTHRDNSTPPLLEHG